MAIKWIDHRGKKVLYIDYRDRKTQPEMLQLLEDQANWMKISPAGIFVLSNVPGTTISSEFMNKSRQFGKDVFMHKTKKSAVVGITGIKAVFMQGYQIFTGAQKSRSFQTEGEALDWLVQD